MAISYLQVDNIAKSYGDRLLFEGITFGVNEGDKIGIIAKNGTGKSTLLNIIAGHESPDSGSIVFRSGLRVALLEQMPKFGSDTTAIDYCMDTDRHFHDDTERQAYADSVRQMLSQLGVSDDSVELSTLSGGQAKRVALAKVILSEPDLIMLDEPTNHLDIGVIEWLENWLTRSRTTLLMVTHDRYFLDRVTNKIIELDRQAMFTYEGNYDYYLRRRAERIEALTAELAKVKNTLRKEQEWMRRQPQARAGKAKYRIDAFYDLKARSQVKLSENNVELNVKSSYIGSKIFEAEGVSKRFGDTVILDDFTYTFSRREKLGIIGHNGAGKSTFIKMLQGLVEADSGRWNVGETVRFGYYSQEGIKLDENKRVVDAITDIADDIVVNGSVRYTPMQWLTHFLFSPADQQKYVHTLSGGERARLHLASVLMRSPNFLILDEPTNDLDIVTLGILEDYLRNFEGCLIVVSHDRFFLDSIVDHLFVFEGQGIIKDFPGSYSDYRAYVEAQRRELRPNAIADTQSAPSRKEKPRSRDNAPKMTFKERREFESLTAEIDTLTAERNELEALFNSGQVVDNIIERSARYEEVKALLDDKEMRWLELSDKQ